MLLSKFACDHCGYESETKVDRDGRSENQMLELAVLTDGRETESHKAHACSAECVKALLIRKIDFMLAQKASTGGSTIRICHFAVVDMPTKLPPKKLGVRG